MTAVWRIKEFSARTGVPEVTLRAWERRYGVLDPERSDGGYRLYSQADERRVLSMQAHISRGIAAAEAARLATAESGLIAVPADPEALRTELLGAVTAFDASRADAMLRGAFALGAAEGIRDVLMPALREIGERWVRGEMTIAHEHFASHLVERSLMQRASGWESGPGELALLACPSGERHTLALLAFGVVLAEQGWRIAYLGADTPLRTLADAAASMDPRVVVLAAMHETRLTDNATAIEALAARHRVVLAGSGATPAVARRLRLERLEADPATAAAALA